MAQLSRFGVAVTGIVVALVLALAGCGGGGGPENMTGTMGGGGDAPVANPATGTYLVVCREGTTPVGFVVVRVDAPGTIAAVAKLYLRGKSSGSGVVTWAGNATWTAIGRDQVNKSTTLSFSGTLSRSSTVTSSGTWTATGGHNGDWVAKLLPALPATTSWTAQASDASPKLTWVQAYAFLVKVGSEEFLNFVFEGPRTSLPCEGLVCIKNPRAVPLNKATDIWGMDLVLVNSVLGWRMDYLQNKPKLTFTARNFNVGGLLTGTISGKLYRTGFTAPVTLTKAAFQSVKMIALPTFSGGGTAVEVLPPTDVSLESNASGLTLNWRKPTGTTLTVQRYMIERSVDAAAFARIDAGNVGAASVRFNDVNLLSGRHAYQYRIRTVYTNNAVSPYATSGAITVTK